MDELDPEFPKKIKTATKEGEKTPAKQIPVAMWWDPSSFKVELYNNLQYIPIIYILDSGSRFVPEFLMLLI